MIATGKSYTVEKSISANFGIGGGGAGEGVEPVLEAGVAFTYSESTTTSVEQGFSI